MHVLIVDDSEDDGFLIARCIKPLREAYPECSISIAPSRAEAEKIMASQSCPDVALIDLKLGDSTPAQMLAAIPAMNENIAVIIVTGDETRAAEIDGVPVVQKTRMWDIPLAITRALLKRRHDKADEGFRKLEELERKLADVHE